MVSFIRKVLVWLAALGVALGIFVLGAVIMVGVVIAAFSPKPVAVEDGTILVVDLSMAVPDSPASGDSFGEVIDLLSGGSTPTIPLRQLLDTLEQARTDPRIEGVLISGGVLPGTSFATLAEVRAALVALAEAKPVYAHMDNDSIADLYLKSAARELWAQPHGEFFFTGFRVEPLFFGDLFERVGIEPFFLTREEYKTAVETFTRADMSEADRVQLSEIIDVLWSRTLAFIGEARRVEPAAIQHLSDRYGWGSNALLWESGLIDGLKEFDELLEFFVGITGRMPENQSFRQISLADYLDAAPPRASGRRTTTPTEQIAVIYAEGAIVDGEGGSGMIGGDQIARLIRQARHDDDVRAIVLRVNCPGGSVTASEKVLREVRVARESKPVVVSMGGIATSGGYFISAAADAIFVNPETITGSIGVVMYLPVIEGLLESFDVRSDGVSTGPMSGLFSLTNRKTPAQAARLEEIIDETYLDFLNIVAEGRSMELAAVRELAKGRVWMGEQALEAGLADRMGGLREAIAHAAELAELTAFQVIDLPAARTFEEIIADLLSVGVWQRVTGLRRDGRDPLSREVEAFRQQLNHLRVFNDPRGMYAIDPFILHLD